MSARHHHPRLAAVGVLAAVATACSSGEGSEPGAAAGPVDGTAVTVTDMAYRPARITIAPGETVTWVFDDGPIRHDVLADGFESALLVAGDTFSQTFQEPGTYDYAGSLHPRMTGVVEVTG